jgi:two-component system sensor histidine kinase VicK
LRTGRSVASSGLFIERAPGRRINIFLSSTPLFDKNGRIDAVVSVLEDRTAEYHANRAKTEFISVASHQLYTPLTVIRWAAEILCTDHIGGLARRQKELIRQIEQENLRMITMVTSLIDVARLETGTFAIHPKQVDVKQYVQEALNVFTKEVAAKNLKVDAHVQEIKAYMADASILELIVQNLLSNAIRYTLDGGSVSVWVGLRKAGETTAGRKLAKDQLMIEVTDTGCGVPEADQPKLFTKMFRADNARIVFTSGTGLGLYIVRSVLWSVDGDIWFTSKEDKGSTFVAALPPEGMKERTGEHSLQIAL